MSSSERKEKLKNRIEFWVIFLAGAFFRLYKLGTLPGGLQRDESTVAMNSYNLFHEFTDFVGNVNPFYMTDWGDGHSNMYVWLTQIPLLFTKGEMNAFVSRLPQAVVAVLTLLAVYGIGKETLGRKFGLWAMLLTTASPWHIMMARWGLDANLAPGFMIFSLYFFIKAVKKDIYLIPAGIMYALTLYTYAVTWVVVPVVLILEAVYMLCFKKLRINRNCIIGILAMFIVAIPPMLFVLVNSGYLQDIRLGFFSIIRMNGYRGDEVSSNINTGIIDNLKQAYHLFVYQADAGEIWEIRKPWGLFFDLGRGLIAVGGVWILINAIRSLIKKTFAWEVLFVIQVVAAAMTCVASFPHLHRINVLYIPLIFCGAYTVFKLSELLSSKKELLGNLLEGTIALGFAIYLILFWKDYTGEYRTLCEAYWGVGMDECVELALTACDEKDLSMITVEKAAQWPKLVLYTKTTASVLTENVVYENYPIPWSFTTKEGILIQTRIDYEAITPKSVYIVYFTDYDVFKDNYDMIKVYDWYVCVPK